MTTLSTSRAMKDKRPLNRARSTEATEYRLCIYLLLLHHCVAGFERVSRLDGSIVMFRDLHYSSVIRTFVFYYSPAWLIRRSKITSIAFSIGPDRDRALSQ
jgi:hypothetical protein